MPENDAPKLRVLVVYMVAREYVNLVPFVFDIRLLIICRPSSAAGGASPELQFLDVGAADLLVSFVAQLPPLHTSYAANTADDREDDGRDDLDDHLYPMDTEPRPEPVVAGAPGATVSTMVKEHPRVRAGAAVHQYAM